MYKAVMLFILFVALVLLFYNLNTLMPFIGDQGWFYLSARDMLLTGHIPLVGITSSHIWLHQGPLWTYITAICLSLTRFSPVGPAYFTGLLGVLSVWFMYIIGWTYFNQRTGLIAAALYATSPLVVINSRMPYHTTLIPICIMLFLFSLYKWVKGQPMYFPVMLLSLVLLYNSELATIPVWITAAVVFIYGCIRKKHWITQLKKTKILFLSLAAFLIPMLPILIYDIQNHFPQTLGYVAWMGYKILTVFGYPQLHSDIPSDSVHAVILFAAKSYQQLVYPQGSLIAATLFVLSIGYFYKKLFDQIRLNKEQPAYMLPGLLLLITLLGFLAAKTVSDAYLPMFFVPCLLLVGVLLNRVMHNRSSTMVGMIIVLIIMGSNIYTLVWNNFSLDGQTITLQQRMKAAKKIVYESHGQKYNLIGRGEGSKFASYTMNYQYLTWYLGNEPVKKQQNLQYVIQDMPGRVMVEKKGYN